MVRRSILDPTFILDHDFEVPGTSGARPDPILKLRPNVTNITGQGSTLIGCVPSGLGILSVKFHVCDDMLRRSKYDTIKAYQPPHTPHRPFASLWRLGC